jgi:hypothetical protein
MRRAWGWVLALTFVVAPIFLASTAQFDRHRGEVVLPLLAVVVLFSVVGLVAAIVLALSENPTHIRGAGVSVLVSVAGLLCSGAAFLFASFAQF